MKEYEEKRRNKGKGKRREEMEREGRRSEEQRDGRSKKRKEMKEGNYWRRKINEGGKSGGRKKERKMRKGNNKRKEEREEGGKEVKDKEKEDKRKEWNGTEWPKWMNEGLNEGRKQQCIVTWFPSATSRRNRFSKNFPHESPSLWASPPALWSRATIRQISENNVTEKRRRKKETWSGSGSWVTLGMKRENEMRIY